MENYYNHHTNHSALKLYDEGAIKLTPEILSKSFRIDPF